MITSAFRFILALFAVSSLAAQGTPPVFTPIPTSPEKQWAIFQEMAAQSNFSVYDTDAEGNITFVGFANNHGRSAGPDEKQIRQPDERPGLTDEDFAKILHFPELQAVATQHQRITDEGYAVLTAFPGLIAVNLSDLKNGQWDPEVEDEMRARITSRVFQYLDGARNLRYWNTTHSFGYDGEEPVLQDLRGFPELRYLNVDVGHANDFDELYPLLRESPKIEFLKLHRTPFTEEQIVMILDALPNLKRLDIKPSGNKPGERWSHQSLALVKDYPNLESLRLIHGHALPLPWEDGLEHLVEAKHLKYFDFPKRGDNTPDPEDLRRLQDARPDLTILPLLERDEFRAARRAMEINPVPYPMEIGPN